MGNSNRRASRSRHSHYHSPPPHSRASRSQSQSRRAAEIETLRHAYWEKQSRLRELRLKHNHLMEQVEDTLKGLRPRILVDRQYTQTRLAASLTAGELRELCEDVDEQIRRLVERQEGLIEGAMRLLRERQGVLGRVTVN